MPRYGDPDYDPDFDDSPPPSPRIKPKALPWWRPWWYMVRRNKGLIVTVMIILYSWRLLSTRTKPLFTPKHAPALRYRNVDWRLYAYSQYATDSHHLCNAVMVFDALDRLGSRASRVLMYPQEMDLSISDDYDRDSQLLVLARDKYGANLVPTAVRGVRTDNWDSTNLASDVELDEFPSWDTSVSKFLVFNQTSFLRLLHIDSDITVLKNMDDLFLLPDADVAMTRAYWKLPKTRQLSPHLMLLQPSASTAQRLMDAAEDARDADKLNPHDAAILDTTYADSALVLPHRVYGLRSSEFRAKDHKAYHGNDYEVWNADRALAEAALIHFADAPVPKPWVMWPQALLEEVLPRCDIDPGTSHEKGCRNRDVWMDLYDQFRKRRKKICGLLSVPAPEWPPAVKQPRKDSGV